MPKNRMDSTRRNPLMQIARKLVQTYELRRRDMKSMETDLSYLRRGFKASHERSISDCRRGTDGAQKLTREEQIETLEEMLDSFYYMNTIVDEAFEAAVSDIEDSEIKKQIKDCLHLALGEGKEIEFRFLPYPYDYPRCDYEERKRILLKYIIRELNLMPYSRYIRNKPEHLRKVKKDEDKTAETGDTGEAR